MAAQKSSRTVLLFAALSLSAVAQASFPSTALAGGMPDAIRREIDSISRMNERCRGGPRVRAGATDAEVEKAEAEREAVCEGRDDAIAGMRAKGWCFGKDSDEREADRVWRKCGK